MKKKWSDILIISICIIIVGVFFIRGICGTRGGVIPVEASEDTPTPDPNDTPTPDPNESPTPDPEVSSSSGESSSGEDTTTPSVSPSPTGSADTSASPTANPTLTQTVIATPTPKPEKIEASFHGGTAIVGKKYDKDRLEVYLVYNDGSKERVTDFTVSTDTVLTTGRNTIVVMYKTMVTKVFIYGKLLTKILVDTNKKTYGIGNMPDKKDLIVKGYYSDGTLELITDDYEISPKVLDKIGENEITVKYDDVTASCTVIAKSWKSIEALTVVYGKEQMVTNMKVNRDDLTVMAVYDDLSSERITTYDIEKEVFHDTGKQTLTVKYGGAKASCEIDVIERYLIGMKAEYKGGPVVVGKKYRDSDMHVYLQYVDGEYVETPDYIIHSKKIRYLGENVMTVYYGDKFSASVVIEGVEDADPDFDYVSELTADNGKTQITVRTALPKYMSEDCLVSETLKNSQVKKAYRKLKLKKGTYIAFTYEFVNPDDELELPLTARITIPDNFNMDHTFLFYTPNRKSIMGRTNKTIISDSTFECTLFKAGTYILIYSEELFEDEFEE